MEIYGFAMLDMGVNFKTIDRTGSTPCGSTGCRRSTASSARTAAPLPASGRPAWALGASTPPRSASCGPRSSSKCSAPAWTKGRRRSGCGTPTASSAQSGPGQDLEPVHGHRRVPELARVLGAHRHGVLPQRPGAVNADPGRHAADPGGRTAGAWATPACWRTVSSCRTCRAGARCPTSPANTAGAAAGLRRGGRHARPDEVGRPARRRVRSVRQRHPLGHQPQLEREVGQRHHDAPAVGVR